MEQYDSAQALEAHGQTKYYREASKALGALLAAPPEIEILDSVKR
jgi:quinol monooxygenase YgiN